MTLREVILGITWSSASTCATGHKCLAVGLALRIELPPSAWGLATGVSARRVTRCGTVGCVVLVTCDLPLQGYVVALLHEAVHLVVASKSTSRQRNPPTCNTVVCLSAPRSSITHVSEAILTFRTCHLSHLSNRTIAICWEQVKYVCDLQGNWRNEASWRNAEK